MECKVNISVFYFVEIDIDLFNIIGKVCKVRFTDIVKAIDGIGENKTERLFMPAVPVIGQAIVLKAFPVYGSRYLLLRRPVYGQQ